MKPTLRVAPLAALLACALVSPIARAESGSGDAPAAVDPATEARQQYNAGTQAYAAKRFVEAALHFEAAAAQRAHAVTLYTAALAWEQANRPERAADDFVRALDVPGLNVQQAANARERLASLEKTLGTLDVTAPEGWRVQLDSLTEVATPAKLHALPGVHALTVRAPDKPIAKRDVSLEVGQTTHLELKEEAPEPAPAPAPVVVAPAPLPAPPPATDRASTRRLIGVAALGVGAATLGAGVVLGVNALDARDAYKERPTRAGYDHATSLQTWTNVALIGGGVIVAAGAALVLWPAPRSHHEAAAVVAPAPGGVVIRGVF